MSDGGYPYFVTNRHNVDPGLHRALGEKYSLKSATIAMRAYSPSAKLPSGDTQPLTLEPSDITIFFPQDRSDVAILRPAKLFKPNGGDLQLTGVPISLFKHPEPVEIMDSLFFIGFPGQLRKGAAYDLPIARSCTIASLPNIDYSLEDTTIQTPNTCLVGGLSFAGSSGSPVFMEKNGRIEVLGIMSGHMPMEVIGSEWPQQHPGLSYLTIGGVIAQVFSENNL